MTQYKIEKNIPIEGKTDLDHIYYPFETMQVGDSFFVGPENKNARGNFKVSSAMTRQKQRHGRKFTSRKQDGGMRIWRVE